MYFIGFSMVCILGMAKAEIWSHGKTIICPTRTQRVFLMGGLGDFKLEDVDFNLCTHIIIYELDEEYEMTPDKIDEEYMKITALKGKYRHLKVSSDSHAEKIFKKYLRSSNDAKFFTNITDFLTNNNFDGMNIYFEDLKQALTKIGKKPKHMERFIAFLRRLKLSLNDKNLFITTSFTLTLDFTSTNFNTSDFVAIFDLIQVHQLIYRERNVKDSFEFILNEIRPLNVKQKIKNLIKIWRIPPSKLVLSVLIGGPGVFTKLKEDSMKSENLVYFPYNLGCEMFAANNDSFRKMQDQDKQLMYLVETYEDYDEKFVSAYSTTRLVANYMKFVVENELAGIMALSVNDDDFRGLCTLDTDTFDDFDLTFAEVPKRIDNKFPFMLTINEALYIAERAAKAEASSSKINLFCTGFVLLAIFHL